MEIDKKIEMILKAFAIFGAIGIILFIFIDTKIEGDNIRQYTKTKDSLEAVINKYEFDYVELKKRADKLDSLIKVRKDSILIIKERFYIYKNREIKNPDEATKLIKNFLNE
jgi:hypothetical protein